MSTILDHILVDVRARLEQRKQRVSLTSLEDEPLFDAPRRDFAAALTGDGLAIISEIKRASPSAGVIRADFDVATLARQYQDGGAAALSILTEPDHFQGALTFLPDARAAVNRPLLRKDFIIDPYQLVEARAHGADAVLLIASVLAPRQLYDLHQAADELGLQCLVELYEHRELDQVDFDQVHILGVNNRNLHTFEVDIEHSLRVFADAPDGPARVSESGLRTADELAHVHAHGVDAVLMGETLMRADDPGAALQALREATAATPSNPQ